LERSFGGFEPPVFQIDWSRDGDWLAAAGSDSKVTVWPFTPSGAESFVLDHGAEPVIRAAWSPVEPTLATAKLGGLLLRWRPGSEPSPLFDVGEQTFQIDWSPDGGRIAAACPSGRLEVWDANAGVRLRDTRTGDSNVVTVRWSVDGAFLITGEGDGTVGVYDADDLRVRTRSSLHRDEVFSVSVSPDGKHVASAGADGTVRVLEIVTGREAAILEGHAETVLGVAYSPDGSLLASLARDGTARLWRCRDLECIAVIPLDGAELVGGVSFHPTEPLLAVKNVDHIDLWRLDHAVLQNVEAAADSRRYTNAKVVLLGDTGVGKSGLGLVLSGHDYEPTDSTHGRRVWDFETAPASGQTREVVLWDLAGQPGYRLIHQLHLNEVAVALIVFDSRSETDPFVGVKHWVRALAQARRVEGDAAIPLHVLLVAARADRGGVGVSTERIDAIVEELGMERFFQTSAKEGWEIEELAQAIREAIPWSELPTVSSSAMFERIRSFLLEEKQDARLLSTAGDLLRAYRLKHPDEADANLKANFETCIGRIEGRGLIRRLRFGDYVLLQTELLDAYASALVQAAKEEPDGLGFISEADALAGRFALPERERVGDREQERLLLIATVEELLRHEVALKEPTESGADLVFPTQFTRERPDAPGIHGRAVTFRFEGALHSVYATLAVRLARSHLFTRESMWLNAASYRATVGGVCGIYLRELEEGRGELDVFFDGADATVRRQFEAYVEGHVELRANPGSVSRRRIFACPGCEYELPEDLVERRRERGATTVRCPDCEEHVVQLLDDAPASAQTEAAVSAMHSSANAQRDHDVSATRLKGKIETGDFDVYLCYASDDREQVVRIARRLKDRGVLPWLDVWEIQPGARWQQELESRLKSIPTTAVFVGASSGWWQSQEVETVIHRQSRIIPVVLEGHGGVPDMPPFLDLRQVVDMREKDPDPFERLVWGITGDKPLG
jgi:WD40 repeat protein